MQMAETSVTMIKNRPIKVVMKDPLRVVYVVNTIDERNDIDPED